jgi:hypothetical protein
MFALCTEAVFLRTNVVIETISLNRYLSCFLQCLPRYFQVFDSHMTGNLPVDRLGEEALAIH